MGKGRFRRRRIHGIYYPPGIEPDDIEPLPDATATAAESAAEAKSAPDATAASVEAETRLPEEPVTKPKPTTKSKTKVKPAAPSREFTEQEESAVEDMVQLLQSVSSAEAAAELLLLEKSDAVMFESVSRRLKDSAANDEGKDIG